VVDKHIIVINKVYSLDGGRNSMHLTPTLAAELIYPLFLLIYALE
jgi:hypothetical protein